MTHLSGVNYPDINAELVVAFIGFCVYVIALLKYCILPDFKDQKEKFISKILIEIEAKFVEFKGVSEFEEILTKIKLILENKILAHV